MEPINGAFANEEFESMSRLFSSVEADHFMSHLYGANDEYSTNFPNFFSIDETKVNINEVDDFANSVHTNTQFFCDENSYSSTSNSPLFQTQSYENNHFFSDFNQMQVTDNDSLMQTNISSDEFLVPNFPHNVMEEFLFMKADEKSPNEFNQASNVANLVEESKMKRKINIEERLASKKPRVPRDAQKGKRNASKKNKKVSVNENNEEKNGMIEAKKYPNSCSSDDDNSNIASQEINPALNSSGKTRANRGAATDPQSLYARKRRERINERLRILQNLVPNGTKVDISTMLEEAVHYVKFLQLQIKLLSSDEMWMFAPIAYNGMDMGLYNNISI